MTAVKKFNISHISQHLKLLTNFCPNIVIIGMQSGSARFKLMQEIQQAESEQDFNDIRAELTEGGFIHLRSPS